MIVLADTHALIWWLTDPSRLSPTADAHLTSAEADLSGGLLVSVASRIDLHYLVKKGTFSLQETQQVWAATNDPSQNVQAVPVTSSIAHRFGDPVIMGSPVTDPYDRLIMATALELGVVLVTKDQKIHNLATQVGLTAIW